MVESRKEKKTKNGVARCPTVYIKYRLRAVPLQSVESKLGRAGESEMAKRDPASPRLLVFCRFAHLTRFPRSRDHPEGLLAVNIKYSNNVIVSSFLT